MRRDGPNARSLIAFLAGMWLALTVVERPLWALVSHEAALHDQVNVVRREHKLIALRATADLAGIAQAHANEMARLGYLSHTNPRGQSPLDRARAGGLDGFRLLAENIGASNVRTERISSIVTHWLDSPTHRENVLNPAFNSAGVGTAETSDGRLIVVQLYATY